MLSSDPVREPADKIDSCRTGSRALHRVMSSTNPKPRDLNEAVLVVDGDEIRLRRADEATESGKEQEHTKFIVAANVGVGRDDHNHWPWSVSSP